VEAAERLGPLLFALRYEPGRVPEGSRGLGDALRAWPTPQEVAGAVADEQGAWERLQAAWQALPEDARAGLVGPPFVKREG
jgi:hypothetical protein